MGLVMTIKKDKDDDIKKYTNEDMLRLRIKFNGRDFSQSWLHKHFREMMRYITWLNGKR